MTKKIQPEPKPVRTGLPAIRTGVKVGPAFFKHLDGVKGSSERA